MEYYALPCGMSLLEENVVKIMNGVRGGGSIGNNKDNGSDSRYVGNIGDVGDVTVLSDSIVTKLYNKVYGDHHIIKNEVNTTNATKKDNPRKRQGLKLTKRNGEKIKQNERKMARLTPRRTK